MWFLYPRKTQRNQGQRPDHGPFRPQCEAFEDRCLLSAGALDAAFGDGGLVSGPFSGSSHVPVVVQTDGKIVAGGFVNASGHRHFALVRFNPDGTADPSFNGGNSANVSGHVATAIGDTNSDLHAIALQSDGKIVAVGQAVQQTKSGKGKNAGFIDDEVIAIARYNANGSLDSSFNSNGARPGSLLVNISNKGGGAQATGGVDYANAVAINGNGRIVVGGTSNGSLINSYAYGQFTLLRVTAAGTLDSSFGSGGIVVTPKFGDVGNFGNALALLPNGNILLAGSANGIAVARYLSANGTLDSSFGTNGIARLSAPTGFTGASASGVVVQHTGQIVLAGNSVDSTGQKPALVRLQATGQLDTSFGGASTGYAIYSNPGAYFGIAQSANGDLLAVGTMQQVINSVIDFRIAVGAYLPNGTPDATFGTGGVAVADFPSSEDRGRGVAVQADGKIVAAGYSRVSPGQSAIGLARFLPPNAKIGSFVANPNPVAAGNVATFIVWGISNSNSSSTTTNINFHLNSLANTSLTVVFIGNSSGAWTYSFDTTGLTSGTYAVYAQAVDNNGVLSDPLAISLTVL